MNCRPGDIAVVVRSADPRQVKYIGCMVEVGELHPTLSAKYGTPFWSYKTLSHRLPQLDGISDKALQPLRDNDGVDETLNLVTLETA